MDRPQRSAYVTPNHITGGIRSPRATTGRWSTATGTTSTTCCSRNEIVLLSKPLDQVLAFLTRTPLGDGSDCWENRSVGCALAPLTRPAARADNGIDMTRMRSNPSRRSQALTVLLLFLFGSDYCLVSAFASPAPGRTGVQCHAPLAASANPAMVSCCRGQMAGRAHPRPAARHGSPCCMALSTVSSPQLHRHDARPILTVAEPALRASLPSASIPASRPLHREHRAGSPASPAGGPLALRAPPRV